jgi:Zn finger protein HypA/HybF involved in hydrogenase expression
LSDTGNSNVNLNGLSATLSFSKTIHPNKFDDQPRSFTKKSKSIETGRVEKGSESDQTFKTVNKNFNIWTISTSVWKILPESQKPIEKRDLVERCSKCLTKLKKSSWKFCPECGNELKEETYEEQLSNLSKEELIELLKNK